jgi:GTP pyrophosphokinase
MSSLNTHEIVVLAEVFAKDAHKGQTYGDLPFIVHPRSVVHTLLLLKVTHSDILAAAWLHDVVEDTVYTHEDISCEFGERIGKLVYLLTDKEGKNRAERQKNTYKLIAGSWQARHIKLADRLCNILASIHSHDDKFGMYKAEHDLFKSFLYKEVAFSTHASNYMQEAIDTLIYRGKF